MSNKAYAACRAQVERNIQVAKIEHRLETALKELRDEIHRACEEFRRPQGQEKSINEIMKEIVADFAKTLGQRPPNWNASLKDACESYERDAVTRLATVLAKLGTMITETAAELRKDTRSG